MSTDSPISQPYPQSYSSQPIGRQTPQPPTLHWAIVLALSIVTFGLFYYVWAIRQAMFIKQIDSSKQKTAALRLAVCSCALMLLAVLLAVIGQLTVMRGGEPLNLGPVGVMMRSFQYLFLVMATFLMRKTLTACYGVTMNGVLTWLFGVFYVQYHMTRIAKMQIPLTVGNSDSGPVMGQTAPTRL